MRKKKTNTLSRLACLLLTVSLLWLLPACGSDSASPFPPAEETVRAAAEKLDWTLLPEETQVWAEDQILYTLKTNSQMDVVLSCAVVEGKRTLTENCTAAGLPAEPVFTWEDWKKAISLAETLYGGFSEGELYQTLSALDIPEPEEPATGAPSATGQGSRTDTVSPACTSPCHTRLTRMSASARQTLLPLKSRERLRTDVTCP